MSLFAARQALDDINQSRILSSADHQHALTTDITEEARKRAEEEAERQAKSGWGRLLGGVGGGALALALAPLTGGSSLATMLLSGGLGGLGSMGGQAVGANQSKPSIGKFNVTQDRKADEAFTENMIGQAGMDALTAALTAGALGKGKGKSVLDTVSKTGESATGSILDNITENPVYLRLFDKYTDPMRQW